LIFIFFTSPRLLLLTSDPQISFPVFGLLVH